MVSLVSFSSLIDVKHEKVLLLKNLNSDSRSLLVLFFILRYFWFFEIVVVSLIVGASRKAATVCLMKLANWESFYYWCFFACHEWMARRSLWCNSLRAAFNWRFYNFYFVRFYKRPSVSLCRHFIVLFSLKRVSEDALSTVTMIYLPWIIDCLFATKKPPRILSVYNMWRKIKYLQARP